MIVDAKGIYITVEDPYTKERKTVIDGSTGAAVGSLGHGNQKVIEEIKKLVGDNYYSFTTQISNYPAEELSNFILSRCPPGSMESAVFVNSGSEANEMNMKIAHQYHHELGDYGRNMFISRLKSYHGYTLGCMNIAGARVEEYLELMTPCPKVDTCYPYREMLEGETLEEYKDRLLKQLDDKFQEVGPNKVVAFVTEPLSSSTLGTCPPVPGYLDGVKAICEKYGALMILDEVMCGSGRCGTFCTWEQFMDPTNGPDLQSIGKCMGNGFVTISACLISKKVKAAFGQGSNYLYGGQTYHSHGFNCQAALAVQKEIKEQKLIENIAEVGLYLGEQLKDKLIGHYKCAGDVRGRGGFWSVEFVKDSKTKEIFPLTDNIPTLLKDWCYEFGMQIMAIGGTAPGIGDHVVISPAFILTKDELDKIVEILEKTCAQLDNFIAEHYP